MPAYAEAAGCLGAKLVTFYPSNATISTHHAIVVLFEPTTGVPLVVSNLSPIIYKPLIYSSVVVAGLLQKGLIDLLWSCGLNTSLYSTVKP